MLTMFVIATVVVLIFLLWLMCTLFLGGAFQWGWNILVPVVWHAAPVLTFWQGVGAVVLLQIIVSYLKSRVTTGGSK